MKLKVLNIRIRDAICMQVRELISLTTEDVKLRDSKSSDRLDSDPSANRRSRLKQCWQGWPVSRSNTILA